MSTSDTDTLQRSLARQHRQYAALRSDIGLVMTDQCPVGCRHCLSSCTMQACDLPPLQTHLAWIASVARVGHCKSISITGGEPFVYFPRLLQIVDSCRTHGLQATVFTSGYWATSKEIAALRLKQLADAGLTGVTVSADEYHQESIPLANVARVLLAAREQGISPRVAITCVARGLCSETLEHDLRRRLGGHVLDGVPIEVGRIVRAGRAHGLEFQPALRDEQAKLVCNALGPTIQQDGSVASCCRAPLPRSSPLVVGDLNADGFEDIYRRFVSLPVIPFIQTWGLMEMLEQLIEAGLAAGLAGYRAAREEQMCELCHAILSQPAHVSFFAALFDDPDVRRRLGILCFLFYGDAALLNALGG